MREDITRIPLCADLKPGVDTQSSDMKMSITVGAQPYEAGQLGVWPVTVPGESF